MPRFPNDILIPATVGIGAFTAFMPQLAEMRRGDASYNGELVADVRCAEYAAIGVTVAIGVATAVTMGEWYPLFVAALTCAGMVALFEYIMRSPRPFSPKV